MATAESITDGQKECIGCRQRLPLEAFAIDRSTPDGRNRRCRTCIRAVNAAPNKVAARKRYRLKNLDKVNAQQKAYNDAHRDRRRALRRARYLANKEKETATNAAWAAANPEKRAAIYKRSRQKHAAKIQESRRVYNALHREERGAYVVRYRETEAGRLVAVAASQRRRARKHAAGTVSREDIRRILSASHCHICGKRFTKSSPATLDHVIPLSKGGKHEVTNLAAAHKSCNSRKRARLEDEIGQIRLL